MWSLFLIQTLLISGSKVVLADEVVKPDSFVSLSKGAVAPFTGKLISNEAMAKLIADIEAEKKILREKVISLEKTLEEKTKYLDSLCILKVSSCESKYQALEEARKNQLSLLSDSLTKAQERKWYENSYFNFFLGAVVSGGISVGYHYLSK